MSTNGNDEGPEHKSATVIQWPGTRVAPAEAADVEPTAEAPTADTIAPLDASSVDAFEAAVRRAVYEKLAPPTPGPDVPTFPPRGADDLVAQVYSALSGKEPRDALAEVRDQLAARVAAHQHSGADIIDLAAARESRKQAASETTQKLGGAIKDTFNQFIAGISALNGHRSEVTLDSQFFKEHGPAMLGNLFQGLASALLKTAKTDAPAPTPTPEAPVDDAAPREPSAEAAARDAVQVNVKVDLASILAGLFRRGQAARPAPAPIPTPPSEPPDEPQG